MTMSIPANTFRQSLTTEINNWIIFLTFSSYDKQFLLLTVNYDISPLWIIKSWVEKYHYLLVAKEYRVYMSTIGGLMTYICCKVSVWSKYSYQFWNKFYGITFLFFLSGINYFGFHVSFNRKKSKFHSKKILTFMYSGFSRQLDCLSLC